MFYDDCGSEYMYLLWQLSRNYTSENRTYIHQKYTFDDRIKIAYWFLLLFFSRSAIFPGRFKAVVPVCRVLPTLRRMFVSIRPIATAPGVRLNIECHSTPKNSRFRTQHLLGYLSPLIRSSDAVEDCNRIWWNL